MLNFNAFLGWNPGGEELQEILTKEELTFRLSQKKLDGIELRGEEYLLGIQEALIKAAELLNIELIEIDAAEQIEIITQKIVNNINSI